jgi:hypothetical protein
MVVVCIFHASMISEVWKRLALIVTMADVAELAKTYFEVKSNVTVGSFPSHNGSFLSSLFLFPHRIASG